MAVVNRYTKTQNTPYTPRTLQELMLVPQYKRQQHDLLTAAREEYSTALTKATGDATHGDRLAEEKQKLFDKMDAQRESLESEGFSQSAKSDFIRFNKEYQSAIGPDGAIGKIGAAQVALEKEKTQYINGAIAAGFPPDSAAKNWEAYKQKWSNEFAETGDIKNIDSLFAPKYHDHVAEFEKRLTSVGYSMETLYNDLGTSTIEKTEDGTYILTKKGYKKYGSNAKNIQAALSHMTKQINTPGTGIRKSLDHEGKTPQTALQEIEGLGGIYSKSESDFGSGSTISGFTPNVDNGGAGNNNSLIAVSTAFQPAKFDGATLSELNDAVAALEADKTEDGEYTPETITALHEMKIFQQELQMAVENADGYAELKTADAEAKKVLATFGNVDINKLRTDIFNRDGVSYVQAKAGVEKAQQALDDFAAPYVADAKFAVTEYQVAPDPTNTKLFTAYKRLQENVNNAFKVDGLLEKLGTISEITMPGGKPIPINAEGNDPIGISDLATTSGDIELMTVVTKGPSGKPEMTFRINTKEGQKYDLDGVWGIGREGHKGNIGDSAPVTVRVVFDKSTIETGTNTLMGHIQDFMKLVSPEAKQLVESQLINQTLSSLRGMKWGSIFTMYENSDAPIPREVAVIFNQKITDYLNSQNPPIARETATREELSAAKDAISNNVLFN